MLRQREKRRGSRNHLGCVRTRARTHARTNRATRCLHAVKAMRVNRPREFLHLHMFSSPPPLPPLTVSLSLSLSFPSNANARLRAQRPEPDWKGLSGWLSIFRSSQPYRTSVSVSTESNERAVKLFRCIKKPGREGGEGGRVPLTRGIPYLASMHADARSAPAPAAGRRGGERRRRRNDDLTHGPEPTFDD